MIEIAFWRSRLIPVESVKSREAEERLPEVLRPFYRRLVEEYEFLTHSRYGRGYVAYHVLADLVLAGWRPSAPADPVSPLAPNIESN